MQRWILHTAFHSKCQFQQKMSCLTFQTLLPRVLSCSQHLAPGWASKVCHLPGKFFWYRPEVSNSWLVWSTNWYDNVLCQAVLGHPLMASARSFMQFTHHWPVNDTSSTWMQPRSMLWDDFTRLKLQLQIQLRSPVTESPTQSGIYWVIWRKLSFSPSQWEVFHAIRSTFSASSAAYLEMRDVRSKVTVLVLKMLPNPNMPTEVIPVGFFWSGMCWPRSSDARDCPPS